MSTGRRLHHSSPSRGALFVGLSVGAVGLTTGCGAPETGSLENVKKGPAAKPAPLDYKKLDYSKIDYARVDYAKIDPNKVDLSRLSDEAKAKFVAANLQRTDARSLYDGLTTKLKANREAAIKLDNKEAIQRVDELLKALEASRAVFDEGLRRW